MSYKDKVVIVTGAGSGMGRALVAEFASRGARVAAFDVNLAGATETVNQLPDPSMALPLLVDITNEASVQNGIDEVMQRWGRIDLLCNNAGVLDSYRPAHEVSLDEWNEVMAANATGPFLMAKYAIPHMLKQGKGGIINIASTASFSAAGGGSAYTASKHAVMGLTRQLCFEYGALGIRVNHPGEFAGALEQAIASKRPAVIDVATDIDALAPTAWSA